MTILMEHLGPEGLASCIERIEDVSLDAQSTEWMMNIQF